ncbi:MAG TPA: heme ABC exporter ATP-binding protein CcmA [Candidatus Thermoplasmatota archaeon]|nr:heme ABC exporter ATP-binding protein CcmA [Candidatus Thermoplasmatota archaeon]
MLRLEDVVKRHRRTVLDAVRLDVGGGEVVALHGPNGAGKTTLLRIAATLDRASSGRVVVAGHDTLDEAEEARASVAWAGDRPGIFPELTVLENLEAVVRLRDLADHEAATAVGRLGLERVAAQRAGTLSRGLQQRTALARASLGGLPLVLLDEPAAALDAEGRARLEAWLLTRRVPGLATLVATHEARPPWATRAVRLEGGRVAYDGPVEGAR